MSYFIFCKLFFNSCVLIKLCFIWLLQITDCMLIRFGSMHIFFADSAVLLIERISVPLCYSALFFVDKQRGQMRCETLFRHVYSASSGARHLWLSRYAPSNNSVIIFHRSGCGFLCCRLGYIVQPLELAIQRDLWNSMPFRLTLFFFFFFSFFSFVIFFFLTTFFLVFFNIFRSFCLFVLP